MQNKPQQHDAKKPLQNQPAQKPPFVKDEYKKENVQQPTTGGASSKQFDKKENKASSNMQQSDEASQERSRGAQDAELKKRI